MSFACIVSCKKESPEKPDEKDTKPATVTDINDNDEVGKTPAKAGSGWVPIEIKLPNKMFVGTPKNIKGVPNLEKPLGKPRPPVLAPAGTKNVAFGKPVTSSDEEPIIGKIGCLTDGDKEAETHNKSPYRR